jgi:hypothetical protein
MIGLLDMIPLAREWPYVRHLAPPDWERWPRCVFDELFAKAMCGTPSYRESAAGG